MINTLFRLRTLMILASVAAFAGCSDESRADHAHPASVDMEPLPALTWHLDFEEARDLAKSEGKVMMLEFHGSDWCPPCIKLKNEVLNTPTFQKFAAENLVLVNLDFPRRSPISDEQRQHNQDLAMRFGVQGFPTVILLSPDAEVLDQNVGFPRGGLNGFMSFLKKHAGS